MNNSEIIIDDQTLATICALSPFAVILFSGQNIVFDSAHTIDDCHFDNLYREIVEQYHHISCTTKNNSTHEIWITDCANTPKRCYSVITRDVAYQGTPATMAIIADITDKKNSEQRLVSISKSRSAMLEVTQKIFQLDDVHDIYALILDKSIEVISNASIGTILYNDNGILRAVADSGFSNKIKSFELAIEDSFLYAQTNGALDKTITIPDISKVKPFIPIENIADQSLFIQSTISTPIYLEGKFWGMLCIDSTEKNAFSTDDIITMEFLKSHIENALINHFLYQEKNYNALHDTLTNLYNRRHLEEYAKQTIERAKRYGESFCLAVIDIDRLKQINDHYGHTVGDKVIIRIAHTLVKQTRQSDILARIGGDELVGIYLENNLLRLKDKFDVINQQLHRSPIKNKGEIVACQFSFGIAKYPDDGNTFKQLLNCADKRMYHDKKKPNKKTN